MIFFFVQPVQRDIPPDAGGDADGVPGAGHQPAGRRIPPLPVRPRYAARLLPTPPGRHACRGQHIAGG